MANANSDGVAFNGSATNVVTNAPNDVAPQTPISTSNPGLTKSDDSTYMCENGQTVGTYKLDADYDEAPG